MVGKKVGIRRVTEDRYGRTVAELFLGTTNVQQEHVLAKETDAPAAAQLINPPGDAQQADGTRRCIAPGHLA